MQPIRRTLCHAPAKLILSGEHAVVYGAPALSLCLDLPTRCELNWSPLGTDDGSTLTLDLPDLGVETDMTLDQWQRLATDVAARLKLHQDNHLAVDRVLSAPWELALMAFHTFHVHHRLEPGHWRCRIEQKNACHLSLMGKGLGSSAAMTVGILKGLCAHHQLPDDPITLLSLAQEVEHYQHGHSSGLDPATLIHGGLVRFEPHRPPTSLANQPFRGWLIDTGRPASSTGQAVETVAERYGHDHPIWARFRQTTERIHQAWQDQALPSLNQELNDNQALLETIGVVPERIREFIQAMHRQLDTPDAVAGIKLCGAGATHGQNGGILLVHHDHIDTELCDAFGYDAFAVETSATGVRCQGMHTKEPT
ncbi:mevalonate kinase [Thiomicrospira sp. WB1]|uniref:mevalonate kinase family protein n=1 Tax=Thiomicrospira sp. WB1 TaxID=1685380 RepID=UPI00074ACED2|nr:hypothetical protein [Thiomicrospira sp. WB1]KUJ71770.1 hypothetical protein AVO41_04705 [Thiomicrospira sp. WB1]